ncbi:MAG: LytTR family DNA-binding domain-containing protein [Prevotella sp.]|nr:LytTR family DNA-binding domain-containing protein [Prevotella sp.]
MILSCAIIDDEPLAANMLATYAQKTPPLKLIGTYNSAITAIRDLHEHPVDLLFLDIQMPELSGLEFAKVLPKSTRVVFTTAFERYAIEGYKVNALDYLMKPISYEDFLTTVNKAITYFEEAKRQNLLSEDQFIFVKSDYKLVQIPLNSILYIEGFKDYVKVFVENNEEPIVSLINMKKIDEFLPHPQFMRIHRSYIVHMKKVQMIDRGRLVFDKVFIPISESYKDEVQKYVDDHTLV